MDLKGAELRNLALLGVAELALSLVCAYALWKGWRARRRSSDASCIVQRGEQSMKAVYSGFTFFLATYSGLAAISPLGDEALLFASNGLFLFYLFFLSPWFRNTWVFRVRGWLERD